MQNGSFSISRIITKIDFPRGGASSKSQGGQKAQFAPNFQEIHFLLHFYVTIFWIFQSQGGQLTPLTPQLRRPCINITSILKRHNSK